MITKKPIGTNSNTSWTPTGAATVHEALDDLLSAPDDGTTRVATNTNGAVFSIAIETMENPNETIAGSLVFWFRHIVSSAVGDQNAQNLTYVLKSAGSTFATAVFTLTSVTTSWNSQSYTPTQDELKLITDYDDIDIECTANLAGSTVRLTCIEVQVSERTLRAYLIS